MGLKPNFWVDLKGNIFYRKQINGTKIILATHTKDLRVANKLHQTLEYQALMQYHEPKQRARFMDFKKLIRVYLENKDVKARWSPKTLRENTYFLTYYIKYGMPKDVKRVSRTTYERKLNAVVNWGKRMGIETDQKKYKLEKQMGRTRCFNARELSLLLEEMPITFRKGRKNGDFSAFLRFAYFTGARRGEINRLKPHQIEPARLRVGGKSKERYIKLNSQARIILMEQEKLWDYREDYITQTFKSVARSLEIPNAKFHDLRRTYGLNLIKGGMPIFQVSKLLGHSSVLVTERCYAPLLVEDIDLPEFDIHS